MDFQSIIAQTEPNYGIGKDSTRFNQLQAKSPPSKQTESTITQVVRGKQEQRNQENSSLAGKALNHGHQLPLVHNTISQTVRQPNRGNFLTQLLCCFRPTEPLSPVGSYYKDSQTKKNGLFVSNQIKFTTHGNQAGGNYLLPVMKRNNDKICMVIDLDETLVHSSFKPIDNADFVVPVEIDGTIHQVYVLKRPYVDEFLARMGQMFECVLFTASLAKYADPVADLLDKKNIFRARLFRESCSFYRGNYVKDLGRLGRDLNRVVIVDNSPASYSFHPGNAVPVASWFDDTSDTELRDLIPFFERLSKVESIHSVLGVAKQNRILSQITNTLGRHSSGWQSLAKAPMTS